MSHTKKSFVPAENIEICILIALLVGLSLERAIAIAIAILVAIAIVYRTFPGSLDYYSTQQAHLNLHGR